MADAPAPLEVIFRSPLERSCAEHALVLGAVGIPCEVRPEAKGYAVLVRAEDAGRARAELESYASENRESQQEPDAPERSAGWAGAMSYATAILLVAVCNDRSALGLDWFSAGKADAGLIRQGEWWRTVTALTLHADPAHLLANLVVGGLFGLFAAQALGSGLAWFSILVGGAAGNAINAAIRPAGHTSVGASTAVFAALGMMSAWAWARRRPGRAFSVARWAPLIGGVALLGYLGVGGARTDVAAHVAGFVCGLLLGAAWRRLRAPARLRAAGQGLLAVGAVALLVAAWGLAWLNADRRDSDPSAITGHLPGRESGAVTEGSQDGQGSLAVIALDFNVTATDSAAGGAR